MATPRDIALAVRICGSKNEARDVIDELEGEKMEDLFDELGMEYMDESSLPEDDDERRMSTSHIAISILGPMQHQIKKYWALTNSNINR